MNHIRKGTEVGLRNERGGEEEGENDDACSVLPLGLELGVGESCVGSVARLTSMNWANVMISPRGGYQASTGERSNTLNNSQKVESQSDISTAIGFMPVPLISLTYFQS